MRCAPTLPAPEPSEPFDPVVVELREGSRMAKELKQERNRLGNRATGHDNRFWPVRFAPFPFLPSRLPWRA